MTKEEAIEKVRKEKMDWCETIYATSDGHFFLNSTPQHVLNHAGDNLEIFTLKGSDLKKSETEKEPKHSKDKK